MSRKFDKSKIRCYACNQHGHISWDCPRKRGQPSDRIVHKAKVCTEVLLPDDHMFCTGIGRYSGKTDSWIIDRGTSRHMTWNKLLLKNYEPVTIPQSVKLGNGRTLNAIGQGTVRMRMLLSNGRENAVTLLVVLFVPDLTCNLLSVKCITENGNRMTFQEPECSVTTVKGKVIAGGRREGNLYVLDGKAKGEPEVNYATVASESNMDLWHRRLSHASDAILQRLARGKSDRR